MAHAPLYLDYAATTPVDPRVMEVMLPYFNEKFGNAASKTHAYGWAAEEAVDMAREQVAQLIGATPREIVFTSGATEAINLAIRGVFKAYRSKGNHIITLATEHKAVLDTCARVEEQGGEISYLPVGKDGLVETKQIEAAIKDTTIMIAVMYANNETGVIQPIREIGALAHRYKVLFLSDATQAVGKSPVDVLADNIDLLTCSAHKLYGPKGAGVLYVRRRDPRVRIAAQISGGGHEQGFRSGTLNVPGIIGFGKACALCRDEMSKEAQRLTRLRSLLEQALLSEEGASLNGHPEQRVPHISNICLPGISSEAFMRLLANDIAVATGSACTSASMELSHVLKAMLVSDERAKASVRFSLGRFTEEKALKAAITRIRSGISTLRADRSESLPFSGK